MMLANKNHSFLVRLVMGCLLISPHLYFCEMEAEESAQAQEQQENDASDLIQARRRIRAIHIIGNNYVSTDALLNYIPYHIGDYVTLQQNGQIERSAQLVRNLYTGLKRFRNISVFGDLIAPDELDIYIVV